ncbi:hypothetical protein LFZ91_19130 [Salmonella enterica subsp. enterica serovar Hillingdon]|nr:hypothetical protein LFZ91_19130 [Salmonella enterica subsp. enterica serovar Hillingdon]
MPRRRKQRRTLRRKRLPKKRPPQKASMICLAISARVRMRRKTGGGAKGNGQPSKDSGTSGANGGATGADISAYAKQIQVAIQSRLYDASLYQGKQCVLHISLAPDGSLKSITSEGGDPALCQAALMAAKTAKIPKPPSQAVYEKIKDAKLDFKL